MAWLSIYLNYVRGEAIKGIKGVAKGVLPAKALEGGFGYADPIRSASWAGAVYLNIFHYDVEEFLDTKSKMPMKTYVYQQFPLVLLFHLNSLIG